MYRKILIQILLFLLLFAIISFTFFSYFHKKKQFNANIEVNNNIKLENQLDENTGTLIKNIVYTFGDLKGNKYELLSEVGKVDIKDSDKIFMINVTANINLVDSSLVVITSKYANYNKSDHQTKFFENVKVVFEEHIATSDNLDLFFQKNIALMYNNIIYNKPGTELMADKLEIDLVTKNSKISMYNKDEFINTNEKIKITDKR